MQVLRNNNFVSVDDSWIIIFLICFGVWIFQIVPDLSPMIKDVITLNIHNTKRSVSTYEF